MKIAKLSLPMFVALTATLLVTANSAQAMHAYAEDDCVTKLPSGATLEISLANGQPASPHRIISVEDATQDFWVNFNNRKDTSDFPPAESALTLITKSRTQFTRKNTDDGCFQGYQGTYEQTAVVYAADAKLKQAGYELKRGMKLHFVCYESFDAPTGSKCDK